MPYTTLVCGEEAAKNGLTATTTKDVSGSGFGQSGDTFIVPADRNVYMNALGATGDTKTNGIKIVCTSTDNGRVIYGLGGQDWPAWLDFIQSGLPAIKIDKGDTLTFYTDSTNVNEGTVGGCNMTFNGPAAPFRMPAGKMHTVAITITSLAAVTYNSGAATIFAAADRTTDWFASDKQYYLAGISGISGNAATFGGIMHITGLAGAWKGFMPGIQVLPLSAVTFQTPQPFTPFQEPIGPLTGTQLNTTVKAGMTASSAGAAKVNMHIIEAGGGGVRRSRGRRFRR